MLVYEETELPALLRLMLLLVDEEEEFERW